MSRAVRKEAWAGLPFGRAIEYQAFAEHQLNPGRVGVRRPLVVVDDGTNTAAKNDVPEHAAVGAGDGPRCGVWIVRLLADDIEIFAGAAHLNSIARLHRDGSIVIGELALGIGDQSIVFPFVSTFIGWVLSLTTEAQPTTPVQARTMAILWNMAMRKKVNLQV